MRGRTMLVVVGLALLAVLVSVGMGFAASAVAGGDDSATSFDHPAYPADTEAVPFWIADVSESAPGRSIVVTDFLGYTVFAADSSRVRVASVADDRGDSEYGMVTSQLAPDGSRLAVGDATGSGDDVLVVDLATGDERRYSIKPPTSGMIEVLAWSPDARKLAIAADGLQIIDVESGTTTAIASPSARTNPKEDLLPGEPPMDEGIDEAPIPDAAYGSQAAFSPDGRSIAYDDGVDIEIYRADGAGSPVFLTDKGVWLAGSASWSPDGQRILVTRDETTDVDGSTSLLAVEVATGTASRVARFEYADFSVPTPVGWRSADEVLLSGTDESGTLLVESYGLDGKRRERVLELGYSTSSAQFASGLIGTATAYTGEYDGGPTPIEWRVAVGAGAGLVTALVFAVVGLAVGVPLALRRRAATRRMSPLAAGFPTVPPFGVPPGGFTPPYGAGPWGGLPPAPWPGGGSPVGGQFRGPGAPPVVGPGSPAAGGRGVQSGAGAPAAGMGGSGALSGAGSGAPRGDAAASGAGWALPR